eukprot:4997575-Lingulodinium_polyedra.AAC.1
MTGATCSPHWWRQSVALGGPSSRKAELPAFSRARLSCSRRTERGASGRSEDRRPAAASATSRGTST